MAFTKDDNELGCLWVTHGPKGDYMTGTITVDGVPIKIVCFAAQKSSEKSPDWRVLRSKPKPEVR